MNEQTRNLMFSSASAEWATPIIFYDALNKRFHFTLDPCATDDNHKCARYFTIITNGLIQSWKDEVVFMNPPYGDSENACVTPHERCRKQKCVKRGYHLEEYQPGIYDWIKKARDAALHEGATVVCLLPARTCSTWYHDLCIEYGAEIWKVRGRIRFNDADSAPFPSLVVVFRPGKPSEDVIFGTMNTRGETLAVFKAKRVEAAQWEAALC